jgi:Asp/Glu/hydantoin racemase
MGVASSSASNDLGNITYAGSEPSQEYKDKESAVSRDRTLAIVLGGAAAATLAATLFFTFTRPLPDKQASRSTVGVAIGPASLSLKGNF